MSPTWLDIIKLETENMSPEDFIEPQHELETEESVVGEVGDERLKRLFGLAMQWNREAVDCVRRASKTDDPAARDEDLALATELRKKSQILFDIFWTSLKDEYGLWDKDIIGVRRGWKVVFKDESGTD